MQCWPRGIAVIVQKPLAPDWNECIEIADTARRHGTFLAVHENFRFQKPMQRVREIINSGVLGELSWARLSFRTGYNVYANQPYFYDEERLAILDVGIHILDLARVFLGEVSHVSCETQRRNARVKAEDTATMMLRHASGAVSVVECTYESRKQPDYFPQTLVEIEGSLGALVMGPDSRIQVTCNGEVTEETVHEELLAWMEKRWQVVQTSVLNANAHFLSRLQQGNAADTDIIDNLKTFAIVEAAYSAAKSGTACQPPQYRF